MRDKGRRIIEIKELRKRKRGFRHFFRGFVNSFRELHIIWKLAVIGFVFGIALISIPLYIIPLVQSGQEIRYVSTSIGRSAVSLLEAQRAINVEDILGQYEFRDARTAIISRSETITNRNFQEIIRFEGGQYQLVFVPNYDSGTFPRLSMLSSQLFIQRGNGMISPLSVWAQGMNAERNHPQTWHNEDRIARDIINAYVQTPTTSRVNSGQPIFYGTGVGPIPTYLSILGIQPDNIIPFEFQRRQYFFWYYLNAPHFGEVLSENIDIRASVRMADIIELFDIIIIE